MGHSMKKRRILYAGYLDPGETSKYRCDALSRLGHEVRGFNVQQYLPRWGKARAVVERMPAGPLIASVNRALLREASEWQPDLVWFDKPIYITPRSLRRLKVNGIQTVCYNQDNPFGPREDGCWRQLRKTLRLFDLHCILRESDIQRYSEWRLPFVKVLLSYEPTMHFAPPEGWSDADRDRGLAYTGSPHEDRPAFLLQLAERYGLPLSVAGPKWPKVWSPEILSRYVTGGFLGGEAYREAIWHSRINLAFLTHLNEEDIAHKAMEITACGGFLLAERSAGHSACFEEDREAVFFSSVDECAAKARYYLDHPLEREQIAAAGRRRAVASGYNNDTQLEIALNALPASQSVN
ncbi:glycosyl transferase family 1 [Acidipila rosea]|uniref:Glycosyl transferase family 1 n=2 Tax=Acidipila rosea TaxID=768535 RepID=A0A4R1KYL2_9BACT|nr:glycosyl transferase family 1 [Acidipila rosea]